MISIQLPDGSRREFPGPVTVHEVAASIGAGLAKAALAGRVGQGADARLVDTSYLIERGVDTLVVTGCTTSGCVRGTVVDGFAYNFRILVPHDCVYDRSQVSHAVNLFDMSEKYADVASTEETLVALNTVARAAA